MRQRPARTTSTGFTDVARRGRNVSCQEWKTNPNACLACETDAHGAVVRMRALETGGPLSGHRSGDSTQKEQNEEVRKVRVNSLALSRITDNGASYLAADWEWFVPVESRSCCMRRRLERFLYLHSHLIAAASYLIPTFFFVKMQRVSYQAVTWSNADGCRSNAFISRRPFMVEIGTVARQESEVRLRSPMACTTLCR